METSKGKPWFDHKHHGFSSTQIYKVWTDMKRRCYNPNNKRYLNYGARGIKVCDEWLNPETFCKWALSNGYEQGLQIDRENNDGNYEPSNCKFITLAENLSVGKRTVRSDNMSGYVGIHKVASSWAVQLTHNKKTYWVGTFKTKKEALDARIKKEIEIFGEQKTNIKVTIPKSMIEDTLHWNNGDELKVTCDGKKVTIEKKGE